jgi:hypothetical protein
MDCTKFEWIEHDEDSYLRFGHIEVAEIQYTTYNDDMDCCFIALIYKLKDKNGFRLTNEFKSRQSAKNWVNKKIGVK